MNQQLKEEGGVSLLKATSIEANLRFMVAFLGWAMEWCEENGYTGVFVDGGCELVGVPKKDQKDDNR
jgi:hypothetical protein